MKIEEIIECKMGRVPLAQGNMGEEQFIMSVFIDGTGFILEFENGKKFVLKTEDILMEILKEVKVKKDVIQ